ncbi:diacylglycerol O-acyltransferase 1 [Rhizina undulata]
MSHLDADVPSSPDSTGGSDHVAGPPNEITGKTYAEAVAEPPPPEKTLPVDKGHTETFEFQGPLEEKKRGHLDDDKDDYRKRVKKEVGGESAHLEKTGEAGVGDEKTRQDEILVSGSAPHRRGIRFAPLKIPIERRLQTAAVLWHELAMALFLSLFWFLLAVPLSWPILVPYLIYVLFSNAHNDGSSPYRRWSLLRRLPMWRLYTSYFPMNLHRTVPLDASKNYIFAYHPHGIISHGAFGNFCTEGTTGFETLFPGITNTLLTLDSNFRVPLYREYLLAMGLASVSRRSCEALLRGEGRKARWWPGNWGKREETTEGGRAITIVIGGARESLEARPGRMRLVVRRRRGFLKVATREGTGVVPVMSFGENDLYDQLVPDEKSWIHTLQMAVKKSLGFTVPLFHARGVFNYDVGLMPYRKEINTVVGRPLFPKSINLNPRDEEIDEFMERYISELHRMWEQWKDVFAKDRIRGEEGELQIIE